MAEEPGGRLKRTHRGEQERALGKYRPGSLSPAEGLVCLGLLNACRSVAAHQGGVGRHRVQDALGVRDERVLRGFAGNTTKVGSGVGATAQQVEHEPAGRGEKRCRGVVLREQLDGAHRPVHAQQVEGLAAHRQHPELGPQPRLRVGQVGGGGVELLDPGSSQRQVVGPPMRRQSGVEAVHEQHGVLAASGGIQRDRGERHTPAGVSRVGPAPGERRCDPGPVALVDAAQVCRVETGRQRPRHGVVLLSAGQAKQGTDPRG